MSAALEAAERQRQHEVNETRAELDRAAASIADLTAAAAETAGRADREALEQARQEFEDTVRRVRDEAAAAATASAARLLDAFRAIDRGRSLSEILDTLVACAAREASRAGVLLVRQQALRAWRLIGFDGMAGSEPPPIPFTDAGIIAQAAQNGVPVQCQGRAAGVPPFAAPADPIAACAIPIAIGVDVVAVLYADCIDESRRATWSRVLEVLARHAGRSLESMTAFTAARAFGSTAAAAPAPLTARRGAPAAAGRS
jgi:hypothetical protein